MSYTQTITEFKSMMILAGVWLHALLCSFPFLLGWIELSFNSTSATCEPSWCKHSVYTLYIVVMCFVFPFFITLFCYIKIFLVAQSKYRKVGLTVGTISRSVSSGNRGDSTSRPVSNTEIEMAVRKRYWFTLNYNSQIKGIVVIFTIIGTFLFTWTPYVINLLWKITNRNSEVPDWFSRLSFCMAFICSISYSVIYGLLNRSIRSDMRSILCTQRHFPQSSLEFLRRVYSDMGHSEQFRPAQSRLPQRSISYDCVDMSSVNRSAIHGAHCNSSHDSGTIISLIDENNSGMSPPCTMLPAELFIFGRNSKTPSQQHHSCRKRSWIELPFKKTDVHDKVIKIPNSGVTSEGSISKHLKLFTIQSHNTDINVSRDDLNHSNIASEFFGAYEDELVSVSCHSNRDTDEGITQDFAE
ncbi:G-protein coupled receptor 161-like [Tachypleus tridentatus]|uniref:G-protein coupled receptor 161-like n=1 Tax=Tachypleus tridentatus TaxID=6853 RepID=UPI003FD33D56